MTALRSRAPSACPAGGPEAYTFNQIGNEVILRPHTNIGHVKVTMESWACESGSWQAGCTTTPGATFKAPITLRLYHYSTSNSTTGEIKPGKRIMKVTKTFNIRYRPSSQSGTESRFMGKDGELHNGIAQTISFPVDRNLANDVVWTVGYNTNTSGRAPFRHSRPSTASTSACRPPRGSATTASPIRSSGTRGYAGFTGGSPFVTGDLLDRHAWAGYVPAARFTVR